MTDLTVIYLFILNLFIYLFIYLTMHKSNG